MWPTQAPRLVVRTPSVSEPLHLAAATAVFDRGIVPIIAWPTGPDLDTAVCHLGSWLHDVGRATSALHTAVKLVLATPRGLEPDRCARCWQTLCRGTRE